MRRRSHVLGPAGDSVPPSGTTHVLVMLAHWNVPDSVTPAQAETQMFTDTNGWYRDASYGVLGQTGDVTPWMEIDGPVDGKCYGDNTNTMTQAKTAATGARIRPVRLRQLRPVQPVQRLAGRI